MQEASLTFDAIHAERIARHQRRVQRNLGILKALKAARKRPKPAPRKPEPPKPTDAQLAIEKVNHLSRMLRWWS